MRGTVLYGTGDIRFEMSRLRKATARWTSAGLSMPFFSPNRKHRKVSEVDTIRNVERPITPRGATC